MTFSKRVVTQNTGSSDATGDWDTWNALNWDALDCTSTVNSSGKEIKELDVIGTVGFIMELGNQKQADASMTSTLPAPAEGVDNSPEELAKLVDFPNNYFCWKDEYDNGKMKRTRKVCWPLNPEEQLIIAVDFPDLKLDYSLHPACTVEGEDIKPMRIDVNGKFKNSFERTISNSPNWKTGLFSPKDLKYKLTSAVGMLSEYQNNGHDLSYLVDLQCNWTVVMTKNVKDGKTYYNTKIKNPSPVSDVKTRGSVYTVAEQLEDNKSPVDFCGILFDSTDDHYSKEQLQQVRSFWLQEASKAVEFDKNIGSNREGQWLEGMDYADSGLCKAIKKFGLDSTDKSPTPSGVKKVETKPAAEPKKIDTASEENTVEEDEFDQDIPF